MTREKIIEAVIGIIRDHWGASIPYPELDEETRLIEDLNCDSLDCIELVMEIEDKFAIHIPDEEAERIQTIGQAADLIASKGGAA